MRKEISFTVGETDRQRLEALVADRNTPQKHVWRARIVLLSADGDCQEFRVRAGIVGWKETPHPRPQPLALGPLLPDAGPADRVLRCHIDA